MAHNRNTAGINDVLRSIDRELWVLTASDATGRRGGMVVTSVLHASIVPEMPRMLVTASKLHFTSELVEQSGAFALHLLTDELHEWVWRFAGQSGRDIDKFQGLDVRPGEGGPPVLNDAPAWLECRVETRFDIGDRWIYLAEVVDGSKRAELAPLTMRAYFATAPNERMQALKHLLEQDAQADARAIAAWRASLETFGAERD